MLFAFTVNLTDLKQLLWRQKTHPCTVFFKATGNPREMCHLPIGVVGFCIASFLEFQLGNYSAKYHCLGVAGKLF